MKIIILGAGQVGYHVARYLAAADYSITVVDKSPELLSKIGDSLDVQPVLGFASHPDVLKKAGAEEADLLIAVTASDEVNIVACEVANTLFKVSKKIARIRNQHYLSSYWSDLFAFPHLGIDVVISPEIEVARSVGRGLQVAGASDAISVLKDTVKIIGVRCVPQAAILNTPLKSLSTLFPKTKLVIACISRAGTAFVPHGEDLILVDDEVHFIAPESAQKECMEIFGYKAPAERRFLILGAGNIGVSLASILEKNLPSAVIKLIERDPVHAEQAAKQLQRSAVLCGDALDLEVLEEANPQGVETVIAVTDDDKVNILAALLTKRNGAQRGVTLLNNMSYSPLITSLGVDSVISPRSITVSTILRHIRQGKIQSLHSLGDNDVEIIEAEAKESSNIIGLTTDDINVKRQILVAALIRAGEPITLLPTTAIHVNDCLALIVAKEAVHKVERLFAVRPSYL